jgi:hypothetical protein
MVGGDDGNAGTPTSHRATRLRGAGVTVCVADTGLDTGDTNTMHLDLRGRVSGFPGLWRAGRWFGRLRVTAHTLPALSRQCGDGRNRIQTQGHLTGWVSPQAPRYSLREFSMKAPVKSAPSLATKTLRAMPFGTVRRSVQQLGQ